MTLSVVMNGGACLRYRAGQANVVCDGNSLTFGAGATVSYPSALAALAPISTNSTPVVNLGVSGQTAAQMQSSMTDLTGAHVTGKQNVLVAWELGNSIYFGRTPAQAVDDLMSYCAAARAAKTWAAIIVLMTTPRYQTANGVGTIDGYNANLVAADTLLKQRYREQADLIVDLRQAGSPFAFSDYAESRFTSSGLYNADKVHQNDAGYLVVAQYVAQALRRVRL